MALPKDKMSDDLSLEKCDEKTAMSLLEGTRLQLDPEADVADLFLSFNGRFFWNKLKYVEVRWSPRMTLCAGLCVYNRRPGYCSIRLSQPLLKLRGKVDLVQTLIHEMIHAFLFVTENNKDRDDHGPEFLKHMDRINNKTGLNISVYHTFQEEVRHYQQHVWLCDGPCQAHPPFFGKVHRSINRAPGPHDIWWSDHMQNCGGSFNKISEPEGYRPSKKKPKKEKKEPHVIKNKDIEYFFKSVREKKKNTDNSGSDPPCSALTSIKGSLGKGGSPTQDICRNNSSEKTNSSNSLKDSVIVISSTECSSDDENDEDTSEECLDNEGIFGVFNMPVRFLKRPGEDPDPRTSKVRKPNFSRMPMSKRGLVKNLIKVPEQPTLDSFFKKTRSPVYHKSSKIPSPVLMGGEKQNTSKQTTMEAFFVQ